MKNKNFLLASILSVLIILFAFSLLGVSGQASAGDLRIGVLNIRGPEDTIKYWQQVSDHLNAQIPDNHFVIVPHNYKSMEKAVAGICGG